MPRLKREAIRKATCKHYESVRYLGLTLQQVFEQEDFDPLVALIRACKSTITVKDKDGNVVTDEATGKPAREPMLPARDYVMALKALCEFSIPKLRTQEVRPDGDEKTIVEIVSFSERSWRDTVPEPEVKALPEVAAS